MTKTFTTVLLLASSQLYGQPTSKLLNTYFAEVRAGKHPSISQEMVKPENGKSVLNALPLYYKDTVALVRSKAYTIAKAIGVKSGNEPIRQLAVQQLAEGCKDANSGNAGLALKYLTLFKQSDFVAPVKDSLRAQLSHKPRHVDVLVKLLGFLEVKQARNEIYALSQQSTLGRKDRWSASLALARMGDAQAIDDIMKRVQRMPVADAVVYEVFPDLVYTRTTQAIDYLIVALNNDAKNCMAADAESEAKIPCAYRVMELLAPVLEGFPLAVDESGDVVATDYTAALAKAREWCNSQKDFVIKRSTY